MRRYLDELELFEGGTEFSLTNPHFQEAIKL
jgi:hypothetical protein